MNEYKKRQEDKYDLLCYKMQFFTFCCYLTNIKETTTICTTQKVTATNYFYVFCVFLCVAVQHPVCLQLTDTMVNG